MEWNERYALGIESIDAAHREIFSIVNRVHKAVKMGANAKWTVQQAIKYLKTYTIKHFEDEEIFMRSVNYNSYEYHKKVHDTMRDVIIPKLYSKLEASEYSDESIEYFLAICEKWLDKHILGHDLDLAKWLS